MFAPKMNFSDDESPKKVYSIRCESANYLGEMRKKCVAMVWFSFKLLHWVHRFC